MKCSHKTKNKTCKANAMNDSEFCFAHNPATKEQHNKASRKGGLVRYENGLMSAEPIDLTNSKALLPLLADTVNRVRKVDSEGSIDVKRANCIANLVSKMIEVQKLIVIEERLSIIERQMAK